MKFRTKRVFTGKEVKINKNGERYIIVYFLDDNGKTFSVVSVEDVNINQLDVVNVEFEIIFGIKNIYMRANKIWKDKEG